MLLWTKKQPEALDRPLPCGQSWLSVLGSRAALPAVPQAASVVLCVTHCRCSAPCVQRNVLYLLKGAVRINRQVSEKYHGSAVTGERAGHPALVT